MTMRQLPQAIVENLDKALASEELPKFLSYFASVSADNGADRLIQCLEVALAKGEDCLVETLKLMMKDVKKALDDDEYKKMMNDLWTGYLEPMKGAIDFQKLELQLAESQLPAVQYNLIRTLSTLSPEMLQTVISQMQTIANLVSPSLGAILGANASRAVSTLKTGNGKLVSVALVGVYLAWETFNSISRWWKGEISGKRCAKMIVDSLATLGAGLAGGAAGATLGMALGPLGMVIGGALGSLLGGVVGESLCGWMTQKLFDIPKSEAVENAFRFLGIPHTSQVTEINSRFRQLCLKYHPDKGGDAEEFHKLQVSMAVIKLSKGETF